MIAQPLDHYQWRNRLVLLFAPDIENAALKKQMDIFTTEAAGLTERKLRIIQITPNTLNDNQEHVQYIKDDRFFKKYKIPKNQFTIILIGLDGGEKLRQTKPLDTTTLFAIIDGMPMRRQELKKN